MIKNKSNIYKQYFLGWQYLMFINTSAWQLFNRHLMAPKSQRGYETWRNTINVYDTFKNNLGTEFQYSLIYENLKLLKTFEYKSYTKCKHLVLDTSNARFYTVLSVSPAICCDFSVSWVIFREKAFLCTRYLKLLRKHCEES